MGAPKRFDVDWPRIHTLYEDGVSPYSIANMLAEEGVKLSKQAIMQRAKREGWHRPETTKPAPKPKIKAKPKNDSQRVAHPANIHSRNRCHLGHTTGTKRCHPQDRRGGHLQICRPCYRSG